MDDIVAIALFRHGMTVQNKRKAYLGWTDSPLCPEGNLWECPEYYEHVFSSDLGRCLETAKILFPGCTLEALTELREMNFGDWEGKTYEELKDDRAYQKWLHAPFQTRLPCGESFTEFSDRVDQGFSKVAAICLSAGLERSAVVTHGGVIRHLLVRYAPEEKVFWEWSIPHGHGYELIWKRDGLRRGERCISLREVPLTAKPNGSGKSIS
ncbi:histidine phosphatase family protein [Bacillus sp. REN3]|uniref:histidine phosphatase family protein n=1 Tax=Bacillus sp. REN3 TaxID=2802440 RepID=UPI001AEE6C1F|nr:histidine phosphatase family protein [Bacillus sp. REN3]